MLSDLHSAVGCVAIDMIWTCVVPVCIFGHQDFVWEGSALLTALIVRHGQSFACWGILLQWQRAPSPVFYLCVCVCVCMHMCVSTCVCAHECVCVCEVFSCLHYSLARTFFVFIFSVWSLLSFWFVYSLTINSYTLGLRVFCFVLCHLFFLSFSRWCTGQLKRLCVIDRLLNPSY